MDSDIIPSRNKLEATAETGSESDRGTKCPTLGEVLSKKKVDDDEENNALPPLFVEAHKRLLNLYSLIDDDTDAVSKSRETAVQREIEKQKNEECKQFALESYLARTEKEALAEYKKLDEKWNEITNLHDPLDLNNETLTHREKCNGLIDKKKKVIEYLKEKLKEKDEEFLKEVEDQGSEIDILFNRIEEQIIKAKEAYSKELDTLEEIVDEEKKSMIKTNREKWEKLLLEKDLVDKEFIKKICNLIEAHKQPMLLAEKEHLDYKRIMRTKLDRYTHDLTVQTEFLKSICTLNIEKLTYNKQLLLNKQQDNNMIKEHCKKFNTRMGNKLSSEKKKLEEKRFFIISKMNLYSKKVKKLSNKIRSIDKRCDELALSSSRHYFDLWEYIEKEVEILLKQICICEKIIYEECLFIPWENPNFQRMKPPSYIAAMNTFSVVQKNKKKSSSQKLLPENQIAQWKNISQLAVNGLKYSLVNQNKKPDVPNLSSKNQDLFELNNVFGILGVRTDEQVKLLMKYFLPYVVCPDCDAMSTARESEMRSKDADADRLTDSKQDTDSWRSVGDSLKSTESTLPPNSALQVLGTTSDIVARETEFLMKDENYAWKVDPFMTSYYGDDQARGLQREYVLEEIEDTNCDPPPKEKIEKINEDVILKICTNKNHSPYINPLDISKAVENFTFDLYKAEEKSISLNIEDILHKDRISVSCILDPKEVKDYWESYLMIFNQEKIDLWETMLSIIQDYLMALQKRHNLNAEMRKLRMNIKEFSRLLRKYDADA